MRPSGEGLHCGVSASTGTQAQLPMQSTMVGSQFVGRVASLRRRKKKARLSPMRRDAVCIKTKLNIKLNTSTVRLNSVFFHTVFKSTKRCFMCFPATQITPGSLFAGTTCPMMSAAKPVVAQLGADVQHSKILHVKDNGFSHCSVSPEPTAIGVRAKQRYHC